ncbi:MAG TPA: helix-turn-helix domain-containing protein [Candidatus Eisenbacteria bacterium]|jgi:hypothetical protein
MRTRPPRDFAIRRQDQLRVLRSPLRQEILDAIAGTGPISVAGLARVLDRAPDALHYHVRHLARVGLLDASDRKRPGRRRDRVFDVPGRPLHIPPRPADAAYRSTLRGIVSAMLNLTRRQHAAAIGAPRTTFEGPRRELWASRVTGWLTAADLEELNRRLLRIHAGFRPRRGREADQLLAFTFVLAPVVSTGRRAAGAIPERRKSSPRRRSS